MLLRKCKLSKPRHPAADLVPILDAAVALGLPLTGRSVPCYAAAAHAAGADPSRPTLVLDPLTNSYRCSACDQRGDLVDLVRHVRRLGPRRAPRWVEGLAADPGRPPPFGLRTTPRLPGPDDDAVEVYAELFLRMRPFDHPDLPGYWIMTKCDGLDAQVLSGHPVSAVEDRAVARELQQGLVGRFGASRLIAAGLGHRFPTVESFPLLPLFFTFDGGRPVYVEGEVRHTARWPWVTHYLPEGLDPPAPFNAEILGEAHETVYVTEGTVQALGLIQLGRPAVGVPGVILFRPEWVGRFARARRVRMLWRDDTTTRRYAAEVADAFRGRGIVAEVHHTNQLPGVRALRANLDSISW
jgi:hypothetical protein